MAICTYHSVLFFQNFIQCVLFIFTPPPTSQVHVYLPTQPTLCFLLILSLADAVHHTLLDVCSSAGVTPRPQRFAARLPRCTCGSQVYDVGTAFLRWD